MEQNERYPARIGKASRIHGRKPRGDLGECGQVSGAARVEHPFAHQKGTMGLEASKNLAESADG